MTLLGFEVVSAASDKCKACKSENLFSGYFDADDLAVGNTIDNPMDHIPGVRWTTFCNDCGTEQTSKRRRKA